MIEFAHYQKLSKFYLPKQWPASFFGSNRLVFVFVTINKLGKRVNVSCFSSPPINCTMQLKGCKLNYSGRTCNKNTGKVNVCCSTTQKNNKCVCWSLLNVGLSFVKTLILLGGKYHRV